jgi:hypothetical protein
VRPFAETVPELGPEITRSAVTVLAAWVAVACAIDESTK